MRVFITGITGFTGRHMVEYLLGNGACIHGIHTGRRPLKKEALKEPVEIVECDIRDGNRLKNVLETARPDYVFHFAAKTKVGRRPSDARDAYEINVMGTLTLLESILDAGLTPRILVPGSSAEFGRVAKGENPVSEGNPFRPLTPYAVSKIAQNMTAFQYHLTRGMKIIRTHTFNYLGPRQSAAFVCSSFARQIAEIEKKIKPPAMTVGNLSAYRDFTDVRDVADAYRRIIDTGVPGEVYNVCSGRSIAIREILETLLGLTDADIEIIPAESEPSSSDVPFQTGDFGRLHELTGWRPTIPVNESLKDMLNHWRRFLSED